MKRKPLFFLRCLFVIPLSIIVATIWSFNLLPRSFVGEAISDFIYRFPRIFKALFGAYLFHGAGYYCYKNGAAKWFWRKPKNKNFFSVYKDWWVFTG